MRTSGTQYYVAASADGYIADRENRLDRLLQFGFDAYQEHYDTFLDGVGALAVGARTCEFVLGEGSWPYADLPAWVFTHRDLPPPAGADVRFLSGPVTWQAESLTASATGRNLWVVGGGELAAQFADGGLLDELLLTTTPIVLDGGHPVLPTTHAHDLRLQGTTGFEGGAVELHYICTTMSSRAWFPKLRRSPARHVRERERRRCSRGLCATVGGRRRRPDPDGRLRWCRIRCFPTDGAGERKARTALPHRFAHTVP